jgi:hypothetical protein
MVYFSYPQGEALVGLFISTAATLGVSMLSIFLLFIGQGAWFRAHSKRVA